MALMKTTVSKDVQEQVSLRGFMLFSHFVGNVIAVDGSEAYLLFYNPKCLLLS